jgi:type I restriction enzyme M protein
MTDTTIPDTLASSTQKDATTNALVAKLWNFCNLLRDVGLSYSDYVQQLTPLLFLKMAHELTEAPHNRPSIVPLELAWPTLIDKDGGELERHYRHILEELGRKPGTLGVIFFKAQNKIENPSQASHRAAHWLREMGRSTKRHQG